MFYGTKLIRFLVKMAILSISLYNLNILISRERKTEQLDFSWTLVSQTDAEAHGIASVNHVSGINSSVYVRVIVFDYYVNSCLKSEVLY